MLTIRLGNLHSAPFPSASFASIAWWCRSWAELTVARTLNSRLGTLDSAPFQGSECDVVLTNATVADADLPLSAARYQVQGSGEGGGTAKTEVEQGSACCVLQ